jgi:hypothetical protein
MFGAAAARESDQIAFRDALVKQIIRQPVRAFVQFAIGDCPVRVDDGAFVGKVLCIARQ